MSVDALGVHPVVYASTAIVEIRKGISISSGLQLPPGKDGLDFWLSAQAKTWIEATLGALGVTISVERGSSKAALIIYLRCIAPGITLGSGYPYSRILGNVELFWEHFDQIRDALKCQGVSRLELTLSQEEMKRCLTPVAGPWIDDSYLVSLKATRQIMNLWAFNSLDKLQSRYPATLRWSIRKAIKSGALISQVGGDTVGSLQRLYEKTMREKGAPAYYDAQRLGRIANDLSPMKRGALFSATVNGKPAGMAAVIDSELTRHLIQVAVPKAYRSHRLSDFLVAEAIQDAFQKGKRYFDFMATGRDDAGLAQFKEKWGAESESIYHAVMAIRPLRSRLIDTLRRASRIVAGWRRMSD